MASAISAKRALIEKRIPETMTTSSSWLIRLSVSVTTVAKFGRLGVGGDATHDLTGGELVVERQIARHDRFEGVLAQLEHHAAHGAGGEPLPEEVEGPGQRAG